jgi:hypothetical protein
MGSAPHVLAPSNGNPTATLRLFRRVTSTLNPFNGRLYQMWIKKGQLTDRQLQGWHTWASRKYSALG